MAKIWLRQFLQMGIHPNERIGKMQPLRQKLEYFASVQASVQDGCRLFADGKIKTSTPTQNGGDGWVTIAARIGGGLMFSHYFEKSVGNFLKVTDLRTALEIRDQMMVEVVRDRTIKTMKNVVRKEILKKAKARAVRLPPTRLLEKIEETKEERKPTTVFL